MQTEMGKVLQVQRLVWEKNPKNSDAFAEAYLTYLGWGWEKAEAFMEMTECDICSHFTVIVFALMLMYVLMGNVIHIL